MFTAQFGHRHTALRPAQNRKDLRFAVFRLFYPNLLKQNAEKILLINPLIFREDYQIVSILVP